MAPLGKSWTNEGFFMHFVKHTHAQKKKKNPKSFINGNVLEQACLLDYHT